MAEGSTAPKPGLVLIEGIMGSGKTTTAQFVEEFLRDRGFPTDLYLEGNLHHPADYDGVAVLDAVQLKRLYQDYPQYIETLKSITSVNPGPMIPEPISPRPPKPGSGDSGREDSVASDIDSTAPADESPLALIHYRQAWRELGSEKMPGDLMESLSKYDVYDGIGLDRHKEVLQASWRWFAEKPQANPATYIFDCAFLQNPLCKFLAMHDAGVHQLRHHILTLAEMVAPLNPALIYLYPKNVRETLERIIPERPKEWLEAVIDYHTAQAYGQNHSLEGRGLDGLIAFLEQRQEIEMEICKQLPFPVKVIENPHENWLRGREEMTQFVGSLH